MNWSFLKENIYFWDGSWRDIYVQNVNAGDWSRWIEFVNQNYKIEWYNGLIEKKESKIDYEVVSQYWSGNHDLCSTAKVFIDGIQINSHFFDDKEIENYIESLEDHCKLMQYLTGISQLLKTTSNSNTRKLP